MSNKQYLAEEELLKEEAHIHHWVKYVFAVWDQNFLGLMCRDCNRFIPEEKVAEYVNGLEGKLYNANSQSV